MSETVGSSMQNAKSAAVKALVTLASVLVYVAGVIYAEVHGYSLLSRGVDPELLLWATVGIVALGITALALPMGLHYSFHDVLQRFAAFAFYGIDLLLLIMNAVGDYGFRTGEQMPSWMIAYLGYVVPATPIFSAIGWSLLWILDPAQKERAMIENLKASTRMTLASRVAEQAKNTDIDEQVQEAAREVAQAVIYDTLGSSRSYVRTNRALPRPIVVQPIEPEEDEVIKPRKRTPVHANGQVYQEDVTVGNPTLQRQRKG